jgi:hypothetical protein
MDEECPKHWMRLDTYFSFIYDLVRSNSVFLRILLHNKIVFRLIVLMSKYNPNSMVYMNVCPPLEKLVMTICFIVRCFPCLVDIYDNENCYKATITAGEYIYSPPEWFVASVIAESSSSASIILSGRFFQERSGKTTLRKVFEVMAKECMDDIAKSSNSDNNSSVVKVSEQVCALLFRASRTC